jgi:RimJ/RimL family protein N-acetyltransferase
MATRAPINSNAPRADSGTVPIRALDHGHRTEIVQHLLSLETPDRYLRFGYAATDEQIRRYVERLDFERDAVFGIFNRRLHLIAMAHLAFSVDPQLRTCAEFGVSVAKASRGKGYGSRLFERAVTHARNEGVSQLFIHALSENTAMLKIARNAGAVLERAGSETEAHLRLPPADFDSRVSEMLSEQMAVTDYHLKAQAKQFWGLIGMLQEIRQGVRDARDRVRG